MKNRLRDTFNDKWHLVRPIASHDSPSLLHSNLCLILLDRKYSSSHLDLGDNDIGAEGAGRGGAHAVPVAGPPGPSRQQRHRSCGGRAAGCGARRSPTWTLATPTSGLRGPGGWRRCSGSAHRWPTWILATTTSELGGRGLAAALGHFQALAHLSLGCNDIGGAGESRLAAVLRQCPSLVHLDLGDNDQS